jgi:nucleotide-binding universal stress UspA family protein
MNSPHNPIKIKRILVAIDASRHSLAGLEAAVELARTLDADLTGLFIEDINLLRLGEMPISNQVGYYSLVRKRLSSEEVRRQLATQGRWAYEAVELLSTQRGLRWTFRVSRGPIMAELIRATQKADLVILGKSGWSDTRLLGSTVQAFLSQPGRLTLVLRDGVRLGRSVMAVFDGTPTGWLALDIARELCHPGDRPLILMLIAESKLAAGILQAKVEAWVRGKPFDLSFLWAQDLDPRILCNIARTEGSGLLVIPQESALLSENDLSEVLNNIDCPVLFAGGPAEPVS